MWWRNELIALLPNRIRQHLHFAQEELQIHLTGDALFLMHFDQVRVRILQTWKCDADPEILQKQFHLLQQEFIDSDYRRKLFIPECHLLTHKLYFPIAVETSLRRAVGYEFDRFTPFRVDQVFYDASVTKKLPDNNIIESQICFTPKSTIENTLQLLEKVGLQLDAIDCRPALSSELALAELDEMTSLGSEGVSEPLNLLPSSMRRKRNYHGLLINLVMTAFAVLSLLFLMNLVLENQEQETERLRQQIENQRREAKEVTKLRNQLKEHYKNERWLAEKLIGQPSISEVIWQIAEVLPDHTYLDKLRINENELVLEGHSENASSLVNLLTASPWFGHVAFQSSITVAHNSSKEKFTLKAMIEKASEPSKEQSNKTQMNVGSSTETSVLQIVAPVKTSVGE
ncbi:MAG: PilN domain-containing protein [Aestuariibacter sp.]